jgi:hypothetical protein
VRNQTKVAPKVEQKNVDHPPLLKTMLALQFLRTAQGKSDKQIFTVLNDALTECSKQGEDLLFRKLLVHIGDVSREHNLLKKLGIKSKTGGAQEREVFRAILRWWADKMPESFVHNLNIFAEYSVLENLMYYQITTDRYKGNVQRVEVLMPHPNEVHLYLRNRIKRNDGVNLIARHLPNYTTGKQRIAKKVVKLRSGVTNIKWSFPTGKAWAEHNGEMLTPDSDPITIKNGDILRYPRAKGDHTLMKQSKVNQWIHDFCYVMDWTIDDYKKFRKKQNTSEQLFSSKDVLTYTKGQFWELLDRLTAGQRLRVAQSVTSKSGETLTPAPKWGNLGQHYIDWESNQSKVMQEVRDAVSEGDEVARTTALKKVKVKATGMSTVDIMAKLLSGKLTKEQVDNTWQSLVEKMDLVANVFPIVDGSGSMSCTFGGNSWHWGSQCKSAPEFNDIQYFQVAVCLAITFSTRNPNKDFRNTFGWFSNSFTVCGRSKYINTAPNQHVSGREFDHLTDDHAILSEKDSFSTNFQNLVQANPGEISSTNIGSTFEYFVNLVENKGYHVEDLPQAILCITDGEYNTGKSLEDCYKHAYGIGWHPLVIFWCLQSLPSNAKREILGKNLPNTLLVGGLNEGALSQVLRGIKSGSVNPEDELWAIGDDVRYSTVS